ncbi:DUF5666 domain-containing protein [Rubrivirga sp. IMCC45206]|uniref:DUF5666 domain-containing protein n=1 Tax=Rubrivirga sp. IMCC45206 TaxID=3391614 RepID=UPI00398FEFC5
MTRLLPALLLAVALVGCDATAPSDPTAADAATGATPTASRAVVLIGVVEAERGRWRTVAGVEVATGRATQIVGVDGVAATLDAVGVGAGVEVRGRRRADGAVRADVLRLWSPASGDAKAVEGVIDALDDKTLTVDGTLFVIDTLTRWLDADGSELSADDFEVGLPVAALGNVREGELHASIVKLDR